MEGALVVETKSSPEIMKTRPQSPIHISNLLMHGALDKAKTEQCLSELKRKLTETLESSTFNSLPSDSDIKESCNTTFHTLLKKMSKFNIKNSGFCANHEFLAQLYVISLTTSLLKASFPIRTSLKSLTACFNVSAIDLLKTIKLLKGMNSSESNIFGNALPVLDADIAQHLLWDADSTLWGYVTEANGFVPAYEAIKEPQVQVKPVFPNHAKLELLNGIANKTQLCSNEDDEFGIPNSRPSVADKANSGQENAVSKTINFVFHHVYMRAFSRLEELCMMLRVSDHLQDMWDGFNCALTKHCRDLLWGRDPDIILLCLVYGVTKGKTPANPLEFKVILQCYKKLSNSDPNVHKCISLEQNPQPHSDHVIAKDDTSSSHAKSTKQSGNLVDFYNYIFLPIMKPFFKAHIGSSGLGPATPKQCSPMPTSCNSPVRVAGNIYISPLRDPLPSSPRCLEYKFPSPSHPNGGSGLRSINEMLKKNSPVVKRQSSLDNEFRGKCAKKITFGGKEERSASSNALPR